MSKKSKRSEVLFTSSEEIMQNSKRAGDLIEEKVCRDKLTKRVHCWQQEIKVLTSAPKIRSILFNPVCHLKKTVNSESRGWHIEPTCFLAVLRTL